jgi:thiol:disulfide interchange protein DsbC
MLGISRGARYAAALFASLFSLATLAASEDPATVIKRTLAERYPQAKVLDVQPAPVSGMFTVFMSDNAVVYSDATANFLFVGKLINTQTRKDVATELLDARYPIDYQKLPFQRAIKIVKGDGSRSMAVFEDPDCPYCQELEKQLQSIDNVTEYVFLYPLKEVHPTAMAHSQAIWCSPDRAATWTQWMTDRKPLGEHTCDGDPIAEIRELADRFHVESTPTVVLSTGQRLRGAIPAAQLQALLDASSASGKGKKVASAAPARE